jgi:hypothetical protein
MKSMHKSHPNVDLNSKQNNYQWDKISMIMDALDYLIRQDDQISMSMPECDNINTDGQDEE